MEDIREAAEAFLKIVEKNIGNTTEEKEAMEALRAALRPSREEVANYLVEWAACNKGAWMPENKAMVDYAIQYLREDK